MAVYSTHKRKASVRKATNRDLSYRERVRDRGKALAAPSWWLEIAREKVAHTKGLVQLGQLLARRAKRSTPWSHTVLSKFASGETQPTQELALAISDHYGIPHPFYVPSSLAEAKAMQAVHEAIAGPKRSE